MDITRNRAALKGKMRVPSRIQTPVSIESQQDLSSEVPLKTGDSGADDSGGVFVVEGADSLFLTGPAVTLSPEKAAAWEKAATANPQYTYLQGRFVEADNPNRNNAYWTTQDLEMGQPTVANGPLNWLHDDQHIVGVLTDSELVYRERAAQGEVGTHITAMAVVWKFLYPRETQMIEKASADRSLWYSMECTSQTVTCIDSPGRPGCGGTFPYAQVQLEPTKVCNHLREKSSVRRFGDPTFLGGAVIIPPVVPGWGDANAAVMRQAAAISERAHLTEQLTETEAASMVAMVLRYANGGSKQVSKQASK